MLFEIDGVGIKDPDTYKWDWEDLSEADAGRTEAGSMDKKLVGNVRSASVGWKFLTTAEISTILKAIHKEYMQVKFLCPYTGGFDIAEMYVGDRTAALYSSDEKLWTDFSFKFVERSLMD